MKKIFLFIIISFTFILMPRVNAKSTITTKQPSGMYYTSSSGVNNLTLYSSNINNLKETFYGSSLPRSSYGIGWIFDTPTDVANTFTTLDFAINFGFSSWLSPPFSVYIASNNTISSCNLNPSYDYKNEFSVGVVSVSCPNAYIGDKFDVVIPWAEQSYKDQDHDSAYITRVTFKHDAYIYDSIQDNTQAVNDNTQAIKDSESKLESSLDKNTNSLLESNNKLLDFFNQTFNSCHDSKNLLNYNRTYSNVFSNYFAFTIDVPEFTLTANKTYYASVEARVSNSKTVSGLLFKPNTGSLTLESISNPPLTSEYQRYVRKFVPTENLTINKIFVQSQNAQSRSSIQFKNFMISEDNIEYEAYGKKICKNKMDETNDKLDENKQAIKEQTDATNKQTDTIKDSNTDEASSSASGFFGNFKSDDFGLSDIITMPLTFIKGLSNNKCNNLNIPIPFVNQTASLPCMTSIYEQYAKDFLTLYQTITTGFIAYWVCINIFGMVQGFKKPDSDNVEVLDL